jgi:hypothetical protein
MLITPQACRRIAGAVQALPDPHSKTIWVAWVRQGGAPNRPRTDVPYNIAAIALEALEADERRIEEQLSTPTIDEDAEADLLNDLGYIQAIGATLRNEGIGS